MSVLSDLDDLILRSKSHPPLSTKGSELTYGEWDDQSILVYDAVQSIVSGSNVTAYDAGKTYDMFSTDVRDQYAGYDGRIWKASYVGSPSTFSGQTPEEGIYWTQVTLAEMIPNILTLIRNSENGYQAPYEETVTIPNDPAGVTITIPSSTYDGNVVSVDIWHDDAKVTGLVITRGVDGSDKTVTIRSTKEYTDAEVTITLK